VDEPSAPSPITLGSFLRQAREHAGHSLRGLAHIANVAVTTIQRLENDEVGHPSPIVLQQLADALELDVAGLLSLLGVRVAPTELPDLPEYLKTTYPHLPPEALNEAQRRLEDILQIYE
jgi:transcriptional regulator with XRE-family HTH domain